MGVLVHESRPNEVAEITRVFSRDGHMWYQVKWPNGVGNGGQYRDDSPGMTFTLVS